MIAAGDWVKMKGREDVGFVRWANTKTWLGVTTLYVYFPSKGKSINISAAKVDLYNDILPEVKQEFIDMALDLRRFDWLKEEDK